ncbi:unnamed protein product [Amoebophrya sp. A120]|nr:unnamed protein product [Amoebophrya sp. A120]|eukprot:GSA120T00002025001.1
MATLSADDCTSGLLPAGSALVSKTGRTLYATQDSEVPAEMKYLVSAGQAPMFSKGAAGSWWFPKPEIRASDANNPNQTSSHTMKALEARVMGLEDKVQKIDVTAAEAKKEAMFAREDATAARSEARAARQDAWTAKLDAKITTAHSLIKDFHCNVLQGEESGIRLSSGRLYSSLEHLPKFSDLQVRWHLVINSGDLGLMKKEAVAIFEKGTLLQHEAEQMIKATANRARDFPPAYVVMASNLHELAKMLQSLAVATQMLIQGPLGDKDPDSATASTVSSARG